MRGWSPQKQPLSGHLACQPPSAGARGRRLATDRPIRVRAGRLDSLAPQPQAACARLARGSASALQRKPGASASLRWISWLGPIGQHPGQPGLYFNPTRHWPSSLGASGPGGSSGPNPSWVTWYFYPWLNPLRSSAPAPGHLPGHADGAPCAVFLRRLAPHAHCLQSRKRRIFRSFCSISRDRNAGRMAAMAQSFACRSLSR